MPLRHRLVRLLWLPPVLAAATATWLYVIQGGFAGGDWPHDRLLILLALPWCLIPLPDLFPVPAFLWFILVPLLMNLLLAGAIAWILRRLLN